MAINTGSSKRACASIYFRFKSFQACVHDSTPISCPVLIKFGTYRFTLPRERTRSFVTQPEVTYAHARNLILRGENPVITIPCRSRRKEQYNDNETKPMLIEVLSHVT